MWLFVTVLLLFGASAALPSVTPLPPKIPAVVAAGEIVAPLMMQFFTVLPFAPLEALALTIQITVERPVWLFVIVRLRSVPPDRDPSMVTLSAPLRVIMPMFAGALPEMVL